MPTSVRKYVQAEQAVRDLIRHLGDDPDRPGLRDTPRRFLKALLEIAGNQQDAGEQLTTRFEELHVDEMVVLRDVAFTSLCEHHLLPFTGTATVAYIPKDGVIIGLSKLARLVVVAAGRLQVQERLTWQVADAIMRKLDPVGAACVIRAKHSCLGCRGVKQPSAEMVTSTMLGAFRDNAEARRELLDLTR